MLCPGSVWFFFDVSLQAWLLAGEERAALYTAQELNPTFFAFLELRLALYLTPSRHSWGQTLGGGGGGGEKK